VDRSGAAAAPPGLPGLPTSPSLPYLRVPRLDGAGRTGALLAGVSWQRAATLGPLLLADGSTAAEQPTTVRVGRDGRALYVRFECADRDAWGTYDRRNDPIYLEEAVELFLAPGAEDPRRYWEIELSPLGVLFAARIHNPTGRRADLVADTSWESPGLEWRVGAAGGAAGQDWWAELALPWTTLALGGEAPPAAGPSGSPAHRSAPLPARWRANFYRIERLRGGPAELSCWSPTLTDPPDFHRPERFGVLDLD
jgi:hypothetical protein